MIKQETMKKGGYFTISDEVQGTLAAKKIMSKEKVNLRSLIKFLIKKDFLVINCEIIEPTVSKTIINFMKNTLNLIVFIGSIIRWLYSERAQTDYDGNIYRKYTRIIAEWNGVSDEANRIIANETTSAPKVWVWLQSVYNLAAMHKKPVNDISIIGACGPILTTGKVPLRDNDSAELSKLLGDNDNKSKKNLNNNSIKLNDKKDNNKAKQNQNGGRGNGRGRGRGGFRGGYRGGWHQGSNRNRSFSQAFGEPNYYPTQSQTFQAPQQMPMHPPTQTPMGLNVPQNKKSKIIPTKASASAKNCKFFANDTCNRGSNCRWVHQI